MLFTGCAQIEGYYHSVKNSFSKNENHDNSVASLEEAKRYEVSGNPAEAERLYLDYVNQASSAGNGESVAVAYSRLGVITARRGEYPASADYFEKAMKLNPNDIEISGAYAQSLFEQKKYADAENLLRQTLVLKPEDKRIQYLLGHTLAEQKKYSLASRYLKQVLGDEKAYQEMAMIYERHGEKNAAALAVAKARQSRMNDQQPSYAVALPASHVSETLRQFQQEQLAQRNLGASENLGNSNVGNVYVSQPGQQTARISNNPPGNSSGLPDILNGGVNGGGYQNSGYQGIANDDGYASTQAASTQAMMQKSSQAYHTSQMTLPDNAGTYNTGILQNFSQQPTGYAVTRANSTQAGTQNSVQYARLANPPSQGEGVLPSPVFSDWQQNGMFPAQQSGMSSGTLQQPIPPQKLPPPQGYAQTTAPPSYDPGGDRPQYEQYGTSELAMRTDRWASPQINNPANNPLAQRNAVTVPPISVQAGQVSSPYPQPPTGNAVSSFYDSTQGNQEFRMFDTNVIKPGERPVFLINEI